MPHPVYGTNYGLNKLKKHGSQNVYFFPNGEFVRYGSRKYPTYFACVFWSDLK